MTTRQEESFVATDADGNEYTVFNYCEMIDTTDSRSRMPTQVPAKMGNLRTSDGRAVNRVAKGSYEIVGLPMIPITSDDINAP